MARPAILITGAAGEVGHSLIEFFSKENEFQVVAMDMRDINRPSYVANDFVSIPGDITNKDTIAQLFNTYDIRQVFHLAAILSTGGERNPERTHFVNVEGSFNLITAAKTYSQKIGTPVRFLFPSSIAAYGVPSVEEKMKAGKLNEDQYQAPITMYGMNKVYVENLGRYFTSFYKFLESDSNDIKIDFRAVRFPGLMSSETLPTGGTSDYASEMIHACAQGKPYACFVSPEAKLPFLAMPDGIAALVQLSKVPLDKLTRHSYNVGSFAVTAKEIENQLRKTYPNAQITYAPHKQRESIVNTWPADVDDSRARTDWGWKPNYSFESAFNDYLIPGIARKYT